MGPADIFDITLRATADLPPMAIRVYDDDLDNVTSIFADVCDHLHDTDAVDFRIIAAGVHLPVDVGTELPIILEQLPEALHASRTGAAFVIELFEQGVQYRMSFTPCDLGFDVCCAPFGSGPGDGAVAGPIATHDLCSQLAQTMSSFLDLVTRIAPSLNSHPWVQAWVRPRAD